MEVDTDSFPKLGAESEAFETPDTQTSGSRAAGPGSAGADAPKARRATPDGATPDGGTASAAGAAQPPAAGAVGRNGPWIAAAAAGLVAVIALGVAWSERGDVAALQAALAEGNETLVATQSEGQRALAGGLALLHLGVRVRDGGPFGEELAVAAALLAGDPVAPAHLEMLAPAATHGLPPVEMLQANFRQVIVPSVRRASVSSFFSSVAGMFERALPGGNRETADWRPGEGLHAGLDSLHRAEQALQAGDLEGAVVAVRPYAEATPHARQWMEVAEQWLNARRAVAALDTLALEKLARFR